MESRLAGFDNPPTKDEPAAIVMEGIRRTKGTAKRHVAPTLKDDIRDMVKALPLDDQAHLLHARKLKAETVVAQVAALRFFFMCTLKRRFPPDSIPYPKYPAHHSPKVLSPEEVARLINAARNLQARAMLMLLYSTGVR